MGREAQDVLRCGVHLTAKAVAKPAAHTHTHTHNMHTHPVSKKSLLLVGFSSYKCHKCIKAEEEYAEVGGYFGPAHTHACHTEPA